MALVVVSRAADMLVGNEYAPVMHDTQNSVYSKSCVVCIIDLPYYVPGGDDDIVLFGVMMSVLVCCRLVGVMLLVLFVLFATAFCVCITDTCAHTAMTTLELTSLCGQCAPTAKQESTMFMY